MIIETAERRRELATFLRARRAAADPVSAGFAGGGRRRTPGLRREEVAYLAEISTTLYTWLEQARPIPVSAAALIRVAGALACTEEETQLVLTLLSGRTPLPATSGVEDRESYALLCEFVLQQDPFPAWLIGPRWEALQQNTAARRVFGDWSSVDAGARTIPDIMFTEPALRSLFTDWAGVARQMLGEFRLATALMPGDEEIDELVQRLLQRSPEFREWWQQYPAQTRAGGPFELDHPQLGRLTMSYVPMRSQDGSGIRAIFCLPGDEHTEHVLRAQFSPDSPVPVR